MLFSKSTPGYSTAQNPSNKNGQKLIALGAILIFLAIIVIISMVSGGKTKQDPKNSRTLIFNNYSITVPSDFESSSGGLKEQIITPVEGSERADKSESIRIQKYLKNDKTRTTSSLKKSLTSTLQGDSIKGFESEELDINNTKALKVSTTEGQITKVQYYIFEPKYIWLVEFKSTDSEAPIIINANTIVKSLSEK